MKNRLFKTLIRLKVIKITESKLQRWIKQDKNDFLITCLVATNNTDYKNLILDSFEFNRSLSQKNLFKLMSKIPSQQVLIGNRIKEIGQHYLYKFNKRQIEKIEKQFRKLEKRTIKYNNRQAYINKKLIKSNARMLFDKRKMERLELVRTQLKRSIR